MCCLGTGITEGQALERVQKCALRIIYDIHYISYSNALEMSGLSDLCSKRIKLLHKFVDKCVTNEATQFMCPLNESSVILGTMKMKYKFCAMQG